MKPQASLRILLACVVLTVTPAISAHAGAAAVRVISTPNDGIQPQAAVDNDDRIHLVYFKGDPAGGDIFYARTDRGSTNFSQPIRVNQTTGSAIALGTIRGPQMALGRGNRVHVVWNGARDLPDRPYTGVPLYYTRLIDAGDAFEPERDLIHTGGVLDGGASVTANPLGQVAVFWHGAEASQPPGEASRNVFQAISIDDGKTFPPEQPLSGLPRGVCACCSLHGFAGADGLFALFYRSARSPTDRDGQLLLALRAGAPFESVARFPWTVSSCPMSSASFASAQSRLFVAGESSNRVWFASIDPRSAKAGPPVLPAGDVQRKHPRIAALPSGDVLLAWTEGSGWARGGRLGWQLFDANGNPGRTAESQPAIKAWSFPAAVARPEGTFLILY